MMNVVTHTQGLSPAPAPEARPHSPAPTALAGRREARR
jgi:hypothetical protein